MEGSIAIEYNTGMQWFHRQQQAGFFDGRTLRMARVVFRGAERTATDERICVPGPELGQAAQDVCRDCDGRIRLVLAEEGVYTFSVSLPLVGNFTRQQVEISLQGCFPESSGATLWDYRVVSRSEEESLLEVTEMKLSWHDALADMTAQHGFVFESIIPESSALAGLVPESSPVLVIHRKDAASTLLVCCESGKVLASILVRKADFSVLDITGFLEFCRQSISPSLGLLKHGLLSSTANTQFACFNTNICNHFSKCCLEGCLAAGNGILGLQLAQRQRISTIGRCSRIAA